MMARMPAIGPRHTNVRIPSTSAATAMPLFGLGAPTAGGAGGAAGAGGAGGATAGGEGGAGGAGGAAEGGAGGAGGGVLSGGGGGRSVISSPMNSRGAIAPSSAR